MDARGLEGEIRFPPMNAYGFLRKGNVRLACCEMPQVFRFFSEILIYAALFLS